MKWPGKQPDEKSWMRYLLRYPDRRFANNFRFVMNGVSQLRRHQALTLGNVYTKTFAAGMTMADVKEQVAQDNETFIRSLLYYGKQIEGTKQYFKTHASMSISFESFVRITTNNSGMLNLFLTFS